MMQVWGKVSKQGCKIINPESTNTYLRFYLVLPIKDAAALNGKSPDIISVNWWDWDWEPEAGQEVTATGYFAAVVGNQRTFFNLYIHGNADPEKFGREPFSCAPGVKALKKPDWKIYPHYQKRSKEGLTQE